jgi:hypothetical protein
MSRVLCCSYTLFRSLNLGQHAKKPINNISCYLLQRRFSTQTSVQTAQDVVKPSLAFDLDQDAFKHEAMNVDQLYQQAKRLVETKKHDIEKSMMEIESKTTRVPSNYIRFPKLEECMKAENRLFEMETNLERDIFLTSLITNVVKPEEVINIEELVDRLIQHYEEALDEYDLTTKVISENGFFKWLRQPMLEECIVIDAPDMNDTKLTRKKRRKRMMEIFDHTTIQWTGVTVDKIVENLAAEDYGLEGFPSEAALYLPHVSVTAEEAKERKLSSDQLQKLNEEIINYYEVR